MLKEEKKKKNTISISDFEYIKNLNRGSYGDVLLVQMKNKAS